MDGYPGDRPRQVEASAELDGAVIVAVIAVLVVKVPVHHVVDVIAMRHREVTASRTVNVRARRAPRSRRITPADSLSGPDHGGDG